MSSLQTIKQRFGIIGASPALDNALITATQVAGTDLSVLITGESGVGKEVFSRIIHNLSNRKHNPFIAVNCGAIPEGTINSELFGHAKGSFTGAAGDRKGYFETVNSGTIFLDEVGEMPLETQTRLLRVLEQGEYMRVGDSQVLHTDVRVIAATNVDLHENMAKGRFREDLYYRLSTVPIRVPALKDRVEDIYTLFRKFAGDFAEKYRTTPVRLDDGARRLLEQYHWPGNIRELKNVAEQVSVLSIDKNVTATDMAKFLPNYNNSRGLAPISVDKEQQQSYQEREIMYKVLFDMKKDLNDLKSLISGLIATNNLRVPNPQAAGAVQYVLPQFSAEAYDSHEQQQPQVVNEPKHTVHFDNNEHHEDTFTDTMQVEDSLSLEDIEKDYIIKALKKHRGRRKDAAAELGISERTLYRKIKEFNIKE